MFGSLAGTTAQRVLVVSWIPIVFAAQLIIAIIGILSAYLQEKPQLPSPALRLVLILNMFGEGTLLVLHATPKLLLWCWRRQRGLSEPALQPAVPAVQTLQPQADTATSATTPSDKMINETSAIQHGGDNVETITEQTTGLEKADAGNDTELVRGSDVQHSQDTDSRRPGMHKHAACLPTNHGNVARYAVLFTLAAACTASTGLQICATGFVDPAIVQLVTQFAAVLTALTDRLLLKHPLLWTIWPCAVVMTGGAAMVIVPSVGHDVAGSLATGRGWLGFGMAVIGLVASVTYYLILQANSDLGFSAMFIQYCTTTLSILTFLTLSLPIDGTEWQQQFAGWSPGDWLLLVFCGAADVGVGVVLELSTWRLGASMVAMTKSSRLIFSVVLTKPVLGTTAIFTGLQIAGVVLTAVALTCFIGSHWWDSRKAGRSFRPSSMRGLSGRARCFALGDTGMHDVAGGAQVGSLLKIGLDIAATGHGSEETAVHGAGTMTCQPRSIT